MKHQFVKLLSKGLAPPIFVLMCSLLGAGLVQAITPVDTEITNTASVDYSDASGNTFSAISETAVVEVGAVFAATIEDDELTVSVSAGNQTNIPFVLTNNANSADTFTLTVANDNGAGTPEGETANGGAGSDIDAITFALFHDVNQNGLEDAGDILIADETTSSGTLTLLDGTGTVGGFPDNVGALVLVVDIPSSAVDEDQIGLIITATSANTTVEDLTAGSAADGQGGFDAGDGGALDPGERDDDGDLVADGDGSVQTLITVTGDALLDISKQGALDSANDRISYTLTVTNNGNAAANNIDIVDMIPAGTTFAEMEQINLAGADTFFFDGDTGVGLADVNPTFAGLRAVDVGQNGASAPFPIGGLVFEYDADLAATGDGITDRAIEEQTIDEPTGVDLNDDGTTGGSFLGLRFNRATLAPGSSISVVYTVDYDPAALGAGTDIVNTFCILADLDVDIAGQETNTCSNEVIFDTPTIYAVSVDDTAGDGSADSLVVGDDEDGVNNDTQHEESAASGETVIFTNEITNNGNAADSFTLSIDTATSTFPAGTTFSFFLGGSPLAGNTGAIPAGNTISITVEANLPSAITDGMATIGSTGTTVSFDEVLNVFYIESGVDDPVSCDAAADPDGNGCFDGSSGVNGTFGALAPDADDEVFFAQLTAESDNDPVDPGASDVKNETLGAIREGVADLANSTITIDAEVNADAPTDLSDGIIDDGDAFDDRSVNQVSAVTDGADGENDIITTLSSAPGTIVTFPLFVANEQGSSTSFTVSVDQTITAIPAGWTVVFRPAGGGTAFASTPVSVIEGSEFAFQAEISIPADGALAPAGDYDFAFRVVSNANSTVTDVKVDRVTVTAVCDINEGVGGSDQVAQLGTVVYAHTISNDGNETQTVSLAGALSSILSGANGLNGWTATFRVDTDEDGLVDSTYITVDDTASTPGLVPSDTISIQNAAGTLVPVVLGAGLTFDLAPGSSLDFEIDVFAPSAADVNDQIRVTTNIVGGCEAASIIDDTTIALQVRIDKTVAVDPNCTCQADGVGVTPFLQDQRGSTDVNPGQCLIWRLTVTNEGTVTANDVVISDQVTPFSVPIASGNFGPTNPSGNTSMPAASTHFQVCADNNAIGTGAPGTDCLTPGNINDANAHDPDGAGPLGPVDLVNLSGSNVTFHVGTGADNTTGGTLIGSNSAVGQFCVQVQ